MAEGSSPTSLPFSQGEAGSQPGEGERGMEQGTSPPRPASQPGLPARPAPSQEACPVPREACQRTLGRGRSEVRRGWERQAQTWQKGNRNNRTREGRNRDVGCSIIHGLIKDAQAPGLSAGFWPLHRGNSSAPILAPAADPVSGSGGGRGWGWGAGGRGPPEPCQCPFCWSIL